MEPVLLVLLVAAGLAAVVLFVLLKGARSDATRASEELSSVKTRLTALEADSKKHAEALEAKRKEAEEAKEKLREVKKRRHEEKESARLRHDIQDARDQIEREMEKKLAAAREEAENARLALKKMAAEIDALRSRKPQPSAPAAQPAAAEAPAAPLSAPREATPEERARLEAAERNLTKAKQKLDELEGEVKRARGRAETDRRVFLVQKSELDVAKDKYRALEARHNALVLERDELHKRLWTLEKQMKDLAPVEEPAAPAPKKAAAKAAAPAAKPAEVPQAPAPGAPEAAEARPAAPAPAAPTPPADAPPAAAAEPSKATS